MTSQASTPTGDPRDLVLERLIDAPRAAVWRCWTEPALMTRWFTPAPWRTESAELDLRPGGANTVVMTGPAGERHVNRGVYLAVEAPRQLVFTDAFRGVDWEPNDSPFMTAIITLEEDGPSRTRYTARVRHWTQEAKDRHEAMGFHAGWGLAADQLEALAKTL